MSVIVKDSSGDIWLYCKGADSAVMPLITKGEIQKANAHVADFSMVHYPVYDNRRTKATAEANNLNTFLLLVAAIVFYCRNYWNFFLIFREVCERW